MHTNILLLLFLGTETQTSLLKSVAFFLESIATCDARAVEQCFCTGVSTGPPSPQEEEKYNYSKCTILVRIMEFTTTLLNASPEVCKVGSYLLLCYFEISTL